MKFKTSPYFIIAIILLLTFNSCSDNSDDTDIPEAANLLVGEWLLISDGMNYFCGTDEVQNAHAADPGIFYVFNKDGTWGDYCDGTHTDEHGATEYSQEGTWEHIDGDNYVMYFANQDVTQTHIITFEGNDTMKYNITDCRELTNGDSVYSYWVFTRK